MGNQCPPLVVVSAPAVFGGASVKSFTRITSLCLEISSISAFFFSSCALSISACCSFSCSSRSSIASFSSSTSCSRSSHAPLS